MNDSNLTDMKLFLTYKSSGPDQLA